MEVYCPNILAEDFDYLLSIPRSLKAFYWTGKTWTCHMTQEEEEEEEVEVEVEEEEEEEEDDNDESLVDAKC